MATTTIADNIFGKCSAALGVDSSRCDGITALTIEPTTSAGLIANYRNGSGQWKMDQHLLTADFMGKSCFPRVLGIYDWIQATARRPGPKKLVTANLNGGLVELYPFVKMERKGPINNEYWSVSAGTASGAAPGAWKITVTSQSNIPADLRWFPVGLRVAIRGLSSGGSTTTTQWQVAELPVIAGNTIVIKLDSLNAASFLPAAKRESPVVGLLVRNTRNVTDYEKDCSQIPGLNTKQLSPFWIETTRVSYAYCELFEKYLDAIRANNALFREFGDIPSVELNRQIQEDYERRMAWAFFFNKPLLHQTLAEYDQLQQITVAQGSVVLNPNGGAVVGRRAAATGVYELLAECNRVADLQGEVLNLRELFEVIRSIQRIRQANGIDGRMIELWMNDRYAAQFQQGMLRYFKMKGEDMLRMNMELSTKVEQGPFGFRFRKFQLDDPDIEIRVLTSNFFNDLLQAHISADATLESSGRMIWILDWSTIYEMVLDANSVNLESGDLERLASVDFASYGCVMKVPRNRQKLVSKTTTTVVECPQSSLILENMSFEIPEHEGMSGSYADYYGNYV